MKVFYCYYYYYLMKIVPLNSPQFWNRKEEKIAPDDMFFYKYFKARSELVKPVKRQKLSEDDFFDVYISSYLIINRELLKDK